MTISTYNIFQLIAQITKVESSISFIVNIKDYIQNIEQILIKIIYKLPVKVHLYLQQIVGHVALLQGI